MRRIICALLALLLVLTLCACEGLAPTPGSEKTTAASETLPAEPASDAAATQPASAPASEPASTGETTLPRPGDGLTEEEQLAMWKAVLEKMAEDDPTPEEALAKARSGAELLIACGEELLALELPNRDEGWTAVPLSGDWMALYQSLSRNLTDFESRNCRLLLDFGIAEEIRIDGDMACFSLGGRGLGPETEYYDVCYIPSDDVTGCFGWSAAMTFTERDGGWFGQTDDPADDDTFFYQQIGEHLYFCIAHF